MNKFKIGDRVIPQQNKKMESYWGRYKQTIGKVLTITQDKGGSSYHPNNNEYCINFSEECLKLEELTEEEKEIEKELLKSKQKKVETISHTYFEPFERYKK